MDKNKPKGFTLIELLVVIAILATLAVAVTLILNPAELVRQGRDSTRLSDMSALQSAVSLYLADQAEASFNNTTQCSADTCDGSGDLVTATTLSSSTRRDVDSTGWIDINFTNISSGAPLSNLPVDPVNNTTNNYVWASNDSEEYELNANMESTRYANTGDDDVESTDGGDNDDAYEIGNDPSLDVVQ